MAVIRGQPYVYVYPIVDMSTGQFVTGAAASQTVYVSKDGGAFVQTTNSPTELTRPPSSTPTGFYAISLTASEMDGNTITILPVPSVSSYRAHSAVLMTERGRVNVPLDSRASPQDVWTYASRSLTSGVTVSAYASGMSPGEQVLMNASRKILATQDGMVYISDEDHTMIQNDVAAGLISAGYTTSRAQYLDNIDPGSGQLASVHSVVSQIQFQSGLVRTRAEQVTDKTGYELSSASMAQVADAVWDEPRGTRSTGTFGYYLDAPVSQAGGGSGGGTDWSLDERKQIRYLLGMDGEQQVPNQNTPGFLKQIKQILDRLQFDANNNVGSYAVSVQDKTGYTLTSSEHTQIQSDAQAGMNALGYTSTRASYIDASISSRLATSSYTAPDNATIQAISAKVQPLSYTGGNVNARANVVADKSGYELSSTERTSIASAVWSHVVESGHSALRLLRLVSAVLLGRAIKDPSGNWVFRDVNNTKGRVTATVDDQGQRTTISYDGD